jgi:hypothetical protein
MHPSPHLGLDLCAIRLLDLTHIEEISRKCNIDKGLIVKEVYCLLCLISRIMLAFFMMFMCLCILKGSLSSIEPRC